MSPSAHAQPCTGLRVLVVDDDADTTATAAALLEMAGHEVHTALTGAAALEAAGRRRPDVVLLDLGLPGMSGFEVARQIHHHDPVHPPFFIAVTGFGGEEDRRRCSEAGIHLHLLKPVDPDYLLGILARFARIVGGG